MIYSFGRWYRGDNDRTINIAQCTDGGEIEAEVVSAARVRDPGREGT
jgi:hypothetical protein